MEFIHARQGRSKLHVITLKLKGKEIKLFKFSIFTFSSFTKEKSSSIRQKNWNLIVFHSSVKFIIFSPGYARLYGYPYLSCDASCSTLIFLKIIYNVATIFIFFLDELEKYFLNEGKPREELCQKIYKEACKSLQITPMKLFYNALYKEEIRIIGVTMRSKDIKACAIALCVSILYLVFLVGL